MGVPEGYQSLEDAFVRWARDEVDVRAVIAVGSRARIEPPADDWSDLDLMVYTRAPDDLLDSTDWLDDVGPVCIAMPGRTASGEPEILVMFDGGFDVDVVVGRIEDLAATAQAGRVPHGICGVRGSWSGPLPGSCPAGQSANTPRSAESTRSLARMGGAPVGARVSRPSRVASVPSRPGGRTCL